MHHLFKVTELLHHIFRQLSPADVAASMGVCRKWWHIGCEHLYEAIDAANLWQMVSTLSQPHEDDGCPLRIHPPSAEPTPSWNRMVNATARVRSLTYTEGSSGSQALLCLINGRGPKAFSSLKHLHVSLRSPLGAWCVRHLMGENIESLHIEIGPRPSPRWMAAVEPTFEEVMVGLLKTVRMGAANLESLSYTSPEEGSIASWPDSDEQDGDENHSNAGEDSETRECMLPAGQKRDLGALCDVIKGLPGLRTFRMTLRPLSPELLKALSTSPSLVQLDVYGLSRGCLDIFQPLSDMSSFYQLRALTLGCPERYSCGNRPTLTDALELIQCITSPRLIELNLDIKTVNARDLPELLKAVGSKLPHIRHFKLGSWERDYNSDAPLTRNALEPLYPCRCLAHLELSLVAVLGLSDADLAAMALAWPDLQVLKTVAPHPRRLWAAQRDDFQSEGYYSVTSSGLLTLVSLPKLKEVSLQVDFTILSGLAVLDDRVLRVSRLDSLDIGTSTIKDHYETSEWLGKVFPDLKKLQYVQRWHFVEHVINPLVLQRLTDTLEAKDKSVLSLALQRGMAWVEDWMDPPLRPPPMERFLDESEYDSDHAHGRWDGEDRAYDQGKNVFTQVVLGLVEVSTSIQV